MKLRRARIEDAPHFVRIKESLPMPSGLADAAAGGFLLGTDEPTYREYIRRADCAVALDTDGTPVGFGILFPDALVRASGLWEKRSAAQWVISPQSFEESSLCYFEQLAFLPGHRRAAIGLAYRLVYNALVQGEVSALLTTTVREPVFNLASLPFIAAAGGVLAGSIEEYYPGVGRLLSDIHLVRRADFLRCTASHPLRPIFDEALLCPYEGKDFALPARAA